MQEGALTALASIADYSQVFCELLRHICRDFPICVYLQEPNTEICASMLDSLIE